MTKRCQQCRKKFNSRCAGNPTIQLCPRCFVLSEAFASADLSGAARYYGLDITVFGRIMECAEAHAAGTPGHETFATKECLNCRLSVLRDTDGTWEVPTYQDLESLAREYNVRVKKVVRALDDVSGKKCLFITA